MSPPLRRIELLIESQLDNIPLLAASVNHICNYVGMNEMQRFEVELCTVEAVTNAVVHAYGGEAGHRVCVDVEAGPEELRICIRDRGRPMPAEARQVPQELEVDPEDIENLPERGRGLFLIHRLMDEVEVSSDATGNQLVLVKRLRRVEPAGTDISR
ncbi:MAG: ATP-binding protein [Acidobacteriota bacterium]